MCFSSTHSLQVLALLLLVSASSPFLGHAQSTSVDTTAAAAVEERAVATDTLCPELERGSPPAGTSRRPNCTPYRSEHSFIEHVLAAPAYALHYATRPLGWAVKAAEDRFPQVFEGNLPSYGAYPIFETGGQSGFAGGGVLFYNDLPWGSPSTEHNAEMRALIGSRAYNRFEGHYEVADAFDGTTRLRLRGRYANDPHERYFVGGNDAGEEDRAFYDSGKADLYLEADTDWSPRVATEAQLHLQRAHVDPDEAELGEDEVPLPADLPGVGTTNLASAEATVALDLASQTERSVEGTHLHLGAEYARGLANDRGENLRFLRYQAEVVQFVPLPLLPPKRRLALRGLVEKVEPLTGGDVPFYRLPRLGGSERLRGYRSNRFRDEGALLLTAEYRWPVWDNLDAVLFAEAGRVFDGYEGLALDALHASYGGGFHLVTGSKLAFRLELAGSDEGLRTIITVRPAF